MITTDPYGIEHITKPGHGEPEPLEPVSTRDPQEYVNKCLGCPLAKCRMDAAACPLSGRSASAKRRLTAEELLARDEKIRELPKKKKGAAA